MFGENLGLPIRVGEVQNPQVYYSLHHGSSLVFTLFDQEHNLVARGSGMQWNENYQVTPFMEWGQRHCLEVVKGAMPPGQISLQTANFLHLNDTMPTARNLVERRELTALVQIAEHEDPNYMGLVIDVFKGITIQVQSANWNAQSLYLRNANMLFRTRLTGMLWLAENPDLANATEDHAAYPAAIQGA